jgi:hypothetical protein
MKTLLDVYSDYGSIISYSSQNLVGNMPAKNILSQVPMIWSTVNASTHTIVGSLAFIDDDTYVCPIDSYYFDVEYAPIGTTFTLEIYTNLIDPPNFTYTTTNAAEKEILYLVGSNDLTTGFFWKLIVTPPYSSILKLSRVMVGQAWLPNLNPVGDITVAKNTFLKSDRQRNGGAFLPPSVNYRTNTIQYKELDKDIIFSLLDALSRYGSGTTIFVEGLTSTSSFTFTSIYGRLIKWTDPIKSLSGKYSITLTIEETI